MKSKSYIKKILSQKLNIKSNVLSHNELDSLARLLNSGIGFKDALGLIKNSKNKHICDEMIEKLEQGQNIHDVLNMPPQITSLFLTFSKLYYLPLAIQLSIDIYKSKEKLKKEMFQRLAYPCFIILLSFFIMGFTCFLVLPNMVNMFQLMGVNNQGLLLKIAKALMIVMGSVIGCTTFIFGFLLYVVREKKIIWLFNKTNNHYLKHLIQEYITYTYFSNYALFLEKHLSTKEIIDIYQTFENNSIEFIISRKFNDLFIKGSDFVSIVKSVDYFDDEIKSYCAIGYLTSSMEIYIRMYIEQMNERFKLLIKRIVQIIQIISYSSVIMIVLIITQMMLAPLNFLDMM